jgi:hypothetical protein
MSGTGRDYIIARLQRAGLTDFVVAIENGRVSAFAIGCKLGWIKRPRPLGTGSPNRTKRRQHAMRILMREIGNGSRR